MNLRQEKKMLRAKQMLFHVVGTMPMKRLGRNSGKFTRRVKKTCARFNYSVYRVSGIKAHKRVGVIAQALLDHLR